MKHVPVAKWPAGQAFRREATPLWLTTMVRLAGQHPPNLEGGFRAAYLGFGGGVTPAVVAANYPDAAIWAWEPDARDLENARRLRDAAGLTNLVVHERPSVPPDLGGGLTDLIVVDGIFDRSSDARVRIVDAIGTSLRPGGLVCVTYRTAVGWVEIAPVVRLMRAVAIRGGRVPTSDAEAVAEEALALLRSLQERGAKYIAERPAVAEWIDTLEQLDPETFVREYLTRDFAPTSHAQLGRVMAMIGCGYVGSAHATDDLGLDVPDALTKMIASAPNRVLQETYRDLTLRRPRRADIFRLGWPPTAKVEVGCRLDTMLLTGLVEPSDLADLATSVDVRDRLGTGTIAAAELDRDADHAAVLVRELLEAGQAHPVLEHVDPDAISAARRLNVAMDDPARLRTAGFVAVPALGSAIPASVATAPLLTRLGVG